MDPSPNSPPANNWANQDPDLNITPQVADVELAALAVSSDIYASTAEIRPVALNPGWPADKPIPITLRPNITKNPNVGFMSLLPWFGLRLQQLVGAPLNLWVTLRTDRDGLMRFSPPVNLSQFLAAWQQNAQFTALATFPGINWGAFEAGVETWLEQTVPPSPQGPAPIVTT